MTNKQVVQNWIDGKPGKNSKRNLTTDGISLWSYRMIIGITLENGDKYLLSLSGECRVTVATQRHCNSFSWSNKPSNLHIVRPVRNTIDRWTYIYNEWLFPAELLNQARGRRAALEHTEAIITMY